MDFRELIKVFAERFHIRIEMKQIGARQEAGRIGGIGACGRELCCASWISNFSSVTTNSARMQEISLNPQKLAGQCSKLKCCLAYEYDTYVDARKEFPVCGNRSRLSTANITWSKPTSWPVPCPSAAAGYDDQRGDASRRPRQGGS